MPPPQDRKRKTLVDRAGETTSRPAPVPPSSRPTSVAGKSSSIGGVSRHTSYSSSVSSMRPPSSTSVRNVSNGSMTSSAGSGYRAASLQPYRPQSAMAGPRIPKATHGSSRPSTAMGAHPTGPGTGRVVGKREGRPQISLNPDGLPNGPNGPSGPKESVRSGSDERHMKYPLGRASQTCVPRSIREISISTAMSCLSLDDPTPQPLCAVGQDTPVTPSQIPKLKQIPVPQTSLPPRPFPPAEASSPCKSPQKTPKALPRYLNRASNTELAWDTETRYGEIESMYNHFQGQMNGITTESNAMKEMIAMYKERSK